MKYKKIFLVLISIMVNLTVNVTLHILAAHCFGEGFQKNYELLNQN